MGLDSLFERLVIATERIANAMEGATVKLAVNLPEVASTAVEPEKGKRGRKPKEEKANVDATNEKAVTATALAPDGTPPSKEAPPAVAPAQKSFLDDEDEAPVKAAEPVLTEKERRDNIRAGLRKLQTKTNPENALAVLKAAGKVEILRDLLPENFDALDKAIADALAKKS